MSKFSSNPKLKPLFANFCRSGITKYLPTKTFEHLMFELNLDDEWNFCCEQYEIDEWSEASAFEAPFLGLMNIVYDRDFLSSDEAHKTYIRFFLEYIKWNPLEVNFKPVYESLKQLKTDEILLRDFATDARRLNSVKDKTPAIKSPLSLLRDKVFIIHGHDKVALLELDKLLKNEFKLQPVVLQETPGESMDTIFSKFEREAKTCGVAIALFTPDDETKAGKYRPRQNAILELGYFWGRESVQKRIIILKKGEMETPSNIYGVETIEFTKSVEEVYTKLKRQLESWNY